MRCWTCCNTQLRATASGIDGNVEFHLGIIVSMKTHISACRCTYIKYSIWLWLMLALSVAELRMINILEGRTRNHQQFRLLAPAWWWCIDIYIYRFSIFNFEMNEYEQFHSTSRNNQPTIHQGWAHIATNVSFNFYSFDCCMLCGTMRMRKKMIHFIVLVRRCHSINKTFIIFWAPIETREIIDSDVWECGQYTSSSSSQTESWIYLPKTFRTEHQCRLLQQYHHHHRHQRRGAVSRTQQIEYYVVLSKN